MKAEGCEVKHGKHLAFKIPEGKRSIRCDSLGEDYIESDLLERIFGKRVVAPKPKIPVPVTTPAKPNMLIDIQTKMQQGYGEGFRRWATVQNLKAMSKTLIFLQELGLTGVDSLAEKADAATKHFNGIADRIKVIETRLGEITDLQKHIVYRRYRDSGWSKKFYAANESEIIIHKAAKKAFDALGLKKLPTMKTLQMEYATLNAEKKKLWQKHRLARDEMIELLTAKNNLDRFYQASMLQEKPRENNRDIR